MNFDEVYNDYLNYYLLKEHVVDQVPRKLLGMSSSVQDLPDSKPYGFWVDRSGNFYQVGTYGHEKGLTQILTKAQKILAKKGIELKGKYGDDSFYYHDMYEMGWMRVVLAGGDIWYELGHRERKATTAQAKFLECLKDLYECNRIESHD